jgi:hypothetical protein
MKTLLVVARWAPVTRFAQAGATHNIQGAAPHTGPRADAAFAQFPDIQNPAFARGKVIAAKIRSAASSAGDHPAGRRAPSPDHRFRW